MTRALPTVSGALSDSPAAQRALLRRLPLVQSFEAALRAADSWPLTPTELQILQVNVGKVCNQSCRHCHVGAGPHRTESMAQRTFEHCLEAIRAANVQTVDITGGAPELNPHFRWFVERCRSLGCHVMDRCNLTILMTRPHADLPEFFAQHEVEVVCSLPHYRALGTDRQRGEGVFEKSIAALRRLNEVGYGNGTSGLRLCLVTNPVGAFLPGSQAALEAEWKMRLLSDHDVVFDALYTITNMPISRFLQWLLETDNLDEYMSRLVQSFNPATARGVMCRNTLSVAWDGRLYDCDFNQMLELPLERGAPLHIADFDPNRVRERRIAVGPHCFGCTAGAGSSCGGATT